MPEPLVFLNGRMIPASQAHLAISDAGFVQGATVTEMTRTFHKQLWRLGDHLDRLFRSLKYTRMDVGMTREQLASVSRELAEHNARLLHDKGELGLIHFVTPGEYPTYAGSSGQAARHHTHALHPHLPVAVPPVGAENDGRTHLVTPSIRQVPPQCCDPKIKYRSRMHYYLAGHEARLVDPEASALLLDLDGNVTETNAANILIVEKGALVSPTTRNILPGISRATVMELAGNLGLSFAERDIQVYNVMNAEEAFLTSTPFCMLPATRINGTPIGDGRPGPLFRRLLAAWSALVGVDIERQIQDGAT